MLATITVEGYRCLLTYEQSRINIGSCFNFFHSTVPMAFPTKMSKPSVIRTNACGLNLTGEYHGPKHHYIYPVTLAAKAKAQAKEHLADHRGKEDFEDMKKVAI